MTPLFKVFMPDELDAEEMKRILLSGQLTFGEYAKKFETLLKEFIGNPYIITTSNNNYAMLIAFTLLDLKEGDEVIASPMSCLASNQPILNFRAKVVWADIDPLTGTLNPDAVQKKITSRTKVILHYHWGGYPGYIDEINKIGKEHGIAVLDDAIEAFGSEYKGNMIGNVGTDITCFSFQAVRLPNTVDGGAISFSSSEQYFKALRIRDFGINRENFTDDLGEISPGCDISLPGYNAMMSELNGYIGCIQMPHVKSLLQKQRTNAKSWDEYFGKSKTTFSLGNRAEINPNYWIYSILTDNYIDEMIAFRKNGFYASKVHLRNDLYSCFGKSQVPLAGVNHFASKQISVPSGWWVKM